MFVNSVIDSDTELFLSKRFHTSFVQSQKGIFYHIHVCMYYAYTINCTFIHTVIVKVNLQKKKKQTQTHLYTCQEKTKLATTIRIIIQLG